MIKDYLIVDNYFSDPKKIKNWGFKQVFYNKEEHPYKENLGSFPGFRTNYINNLDEHKFKYFMHNLLKASELFYEQNFSEFNAWLSFSYTLENIKLPDFHKDEETSLIKEDIEFKKKLAGVVYLNENCEKEAGTIIINDEKQLLIENKFNRLILYPPDKVHSVAKSFGKTKKDARFVFTILVYLK
jgi:hypothetical protein